MVMQGTSDVGHWSLSTLPVDGKRDGPITNTPLWHHTPGSE